MSSVKSSMVFVIHSNLPSVHLLLLTHPAFILPKLPSCSLVSVYASACSCLITNLNLILIYPNSVCLILNHASKPLLTLYFLVCFLFVCLFVWKSGLMVMVQCRWGEEKGKQVSPIWSLCCASSWSQILDCICLEKLLVRAKILAVQGVWSAGQYWSREK